MSSNRLIASMEAIDFQVNPLLFKELTIHIQEIKNSNSDKKVIRQRFEAIQDSVTKRTGMNINFNLSEEEFVNAWVVVPDLDKNHPLLIDYYREISGSKDSIKLIKKRKTVLKGGVDRKTSTVFGIFSEIDVDIFITEALLSSSVFNSEEVAAVILHELGHLFTYFEYIGSTITTNYVLQHVSRSLKDTRETKRKYEIIEEAESILDINIDDPDALLNATNDTVLQTVILKKVTEKRYSELKSGTYDMTAYEMLSDQFATRQGAGRALVTGLDKLNRIHGDPAYDSKTWFLLTEAAKLIIFLNATILYVGLPLILILVIDVSMDIYDKPKSRLERIKRDLVDGLKSKSLSKEQAKQFVTDIEVIEKVIEVMAERRSLLMTLQTTLMPARRKQYEQLKFQQELEMIVNNDLFTKSVKLKTLNA